ncbi:DeoR/GlpR family DNA-binding transcription regulator [Albidovulum sp.]|uniref:DeoR/GlpR family DNA-binding transcription regulator n=1 Tax=Albidovulum sp. TaxID=1872424 RepID=UPI002BA98CD3|nr:DeoR/GlpR family DNA-binding transcription regulator [Albidovulum sp.]
MKADVFYPEPDMSIDFNARQKAILNQIRQEGRVLVEALSGAFGTTPQTIRRDLQVLEDTGEVMRFHGGASLLPGVEYTGFDVRRTIAVEEKEAIGVAVAQRIPPNVMLMLNGGTTTAAVARSLKGHSGLRVIVDNVNIANDLRRFPGVDVLVPGGMVRRSDGAVTGEAALEFIRGFRADVAVVGAAALEASGALLDFDLAEAAVTREMMAHAKHVILAVDSGKFGRSAPVVIGSLDRVDTIVTDRCANPEFRHICARAEIDLVEAMPR